MSENVVQSVKLRKKSRSSRFANWSGDGNLIWDKLLRGIYVFLLFAIDFVMFIYSVNGKLVEYGQFNAAAKLILLAAFGVSLVLVFLLSFSRELQNLLCSAITLAVTVVFYYQFALFDVNNFAELWLAKHANWLSFIGFIPSVWLVGLLMAVLVFFLFRYTYGILFATVILLFSLLIGIGKNEKIVPAPSEYQVVRPLGKQDKERTDNIVYLMLPKFPSYQFLSSVRDVNFRELRDLLIGFYAVNDFEVYPNAFVQKSDAMSNIIDIFSQADYMSTTSSSRGYAEIVNDWNFIHGGIDYLSLEENQLYDYLRDNWYGVSMYAMPGFNFCLKKEDFYTDRCVVKSYRNVSLYNKEAGLEKNIYALLGEWVLSLKDRELRPVAKNLLNMSWLKGMKILSENRRVSLEGSAELLDVLGDDFVRDGNGQFYIAYVDLPSDVYIYDEFCNVKPREEWIALKDNSMYTGSLDEKRKAYVEQTKCLLGKLQEYLDMVSVSGKYKKTNIFIQGVSPVQELAGLSGGRYSNFVMNNLVNLGIRKGKNAKFLINANVCLASDFTKTLIRYQDFCYSTDNMGLPADEALSLKQNLINNAVIQGNKISIIAANYKDWYDTYKQNSRSYQEKLKQKQAGQNTVLELGKKNIKKTAPRGGGNMRKTGVNKGQMEDNIFVWTDDDEITSQKGPEAKEDIGVKEVGKENAGVPTSEKNEAESVPVDVAVEEQKKTDDKTAGESPAEEKAATEADTLSGEVSDGADRGIVNEVSQTTEEKKENAAPVLEKAGSPQGEKDVLAAEKAAEKLPENGEMTADKGNVTEESTSQEPDTPNAETGAEDTVLF